VAFGDPFQGAKIKGYDGPILTCELFFASYKRALLIHYSDCNDGDSVCTGNFVISAAHLSYTGTVAQTAMREMKKLAA
jgi:hypothetical protein